MAAPTIYAKTSSGQQEIRNRGARLARPLRNLLLCVDGKRDSASLETLAKACGAPDDALQQLEAMGLIAAIAPLPEPMSDAPDDAAGPDTLQPLDPASGFDGSLHDTHLVLAERMIDLIEEHLDPVKAYTLQLDIEQCRSSEALRALIPDLETALSKIVGEARARELIVGLAYIGRASNTP